MSVVSIPFKRESLSQVFSNYGYPHKTFSFHSLQTGKPIASSIMNTRTFRRDQVSIPFKRESVSQEFPWQTHFTTTSSCFHSLQTGKRISSNAVPAVTVGVLCFHSLQTGKRITRKLRSALTRTRWRVSIPFKRESVSQAGFRFTKVGIDWSFHSLQTGKRITRSQCNFCVCESRHGFPFPSNGKAYHKKTTQSKIKSVRQSFHSLQTGKRITSRSYSRILPKRQSFQFPSNGKAYHKHWIIAGTLIVDQVSIPFKRESVSQETPF